MQVAKEFTEDHKKAHGLKAVILYQFCHNFKQVFTLCSSEYAKEMGIKVTQSRQ
jgi:hypothetical protein